MKDEINLLNAQSNIISESSLLNYDRQSNNEIDPNDSFGGIGRNQIYKHNDLLAFVKAVNFNI
jgi:hypothetical protein